MNQNQPDPSFAFDSKMQDAFAKIMGSKELPEMPILKDLAGSGVFAKPTPQQPKTGPGTVIYL